MLDPDQFADAPMPQQGATSALDPDQFADAPEDAGFSFGRMAASLGAEMTIGTAFQMAGVALAPKTFGLSIPVLSFVGGYLGSVLGQEIDSPDEEFKPARALATGAMNMVPGLKQTTTAAKGASAATKELVRATSRRQALKGVRNRTLMGAAQGAGYVGGERAIAVAMGEEDAELASAADIGLGGVFGGVMGGGLEAGSQAIRGAIPRVFSRQVGADDTIVKQAIDRAAKQPLIDLGLPPAENVALVRKIANMPPKQAERFVRELIEKADPDVQLNYLENNAAKKLARRIKNMPREEAEALIAKLIAKKDPELVLMQRRAQDAVVAARAARQQALEETWQPIVSKQEADTARIQRKLPPIVADQEAQMAQVQQRTSPAYRAQKQMDLEAAFNANKADLPIEKILVESRANVYANATNALEAGVVKTFPKALVTKEVADEVAKGMGALREQRLPIRKPSFMADDVPMGTPLADDLPLQSTVDDALRSLPGLRKPPTRSDEFRFGIAPATPRIGEALAALSGGTVGAAKAYADDESMTIGFAGGAIAAVGLYRGAKNERVSQLLNKAMPYLAPSKILGQRTALAVNERKATDTVYNQAVGRVRDKLQNWAVKQDNPEDAVALLSDVLTGKKWISDVPVEIRAEVKYLQEVRTELQQQLLRDVPNLSDDMRGLITASRDQYLTTEYRIHFDKGYKPSPESRAKLVKLLKQEGQSDEDINRFLRDLNDEQAFMGMLTGRGSNRMGIFVHKQNLSKEVREYLGEVEDPLEKIYGTINKMNRIAAAAREEQDILLNGELGGWIRKGVVGDEGWLSYPNRYTDGDYSISKHADAALRNLRGKGFLDQSDDPFKRGFWRTIQSANALSKFAAVPLNTSAYMVQVLGNTFILAQTPGISWRAGGKGFAVAWQNTGVPYIMKGDRAVPDFGAIQKNLDMLRKFNILDQDATYNDIRRGMESFGDNINQMVKPVTGKVSTAYQFADNAARLTSFYSNRQNLIRQGTNLTGEALDREAARITNLTFPNYSRVNTAIKQLSLVGALNQFVAFNAELFRTSWNNLSYGTELIKRGTQQNNAAMVRQGTYRILATTALVAGGGAYVASENASNGIDKTKADALKRAFVPAYDEDRELLLNTQDDKLTYANPSYTMPFTTISNVFTKFMETKGSVEGAIAALDALTGEFIGEGTMLTRSFASAYILNSRPDGSGTVTDEKGLRGQQERAAYFLENAFPVGFVREYNNYRDAVSGTTRKGGRILTTEDSWKRLLGKRNYSYNMLEAGAQKAKPIVEQQRTARGKYRADIERNATQEDIAKSYAKQSAKFERAFQASVQRVADFREAGQSEDNIVTMLKDAGMGSQEIYSALTGVFVPLPKELPTLASDVYESQFAGRTTREQMELLRELARDKDTIQLARGVQSIIRDERRVQVRGLTPKEQLLGKMAIGTGQRAKVLAAELKDLSTEDRNRRLDELARKGLVNQKVRQDVMKELYGQ